MTEADRLPLNRLDTVSAFGDTTTIGPRLFAFGVKLSGREVERLADLFLAVEELALEAEGAAPIEILI